MFPIICPNISYSYIEQNPRFSYSGIVGFVEPLVNNRCSLRRSCERRDNFGGVSHHYLGFYTWWNDPSIIDLGLLKITCNLLIEVNNAKTFYHITKQDIQIVFIQVLIKIQQLNYT